MSDRVGALYRQQQVSAGTLGAFLVVVLVLVSQDQSRYEFRLLSIPKDVFFDGLVTLIALTSLVLISTAWALGYLVPGLTSESGRMGRRFRRVVLNFYRLGFAMVLVVVSLLVIPFSVYGGVATLVLGAFLMIFLDELRLASLREAHEELLREQEAQEDATEQAQRGE